MKRLGMVIFLTMLVPAALMASGTSHVAGWWRGQVMMLPVVVHVEENADGFSGSLYSPSQSSEAVPMSSVEVIGDTLRFEIGSIGASFSGVFADNRIKGTFTQGFSLAITFEPATEKDAVLYRPQTPRPPFIYNSREVTVKHDSVVLAGTLTAPYGLRPAGGVVLVSGSGTQNRDEEIAGHKPFAVIADFLTRCGWAVLRYDDRGAGESSPGDPKNTTIDFAADAMAALRYLASEPMMKDVPVGFIGHSEGGVIALIDAATYPEEVAFIISLAGPALKGERVMVRQNELIYEMAGTAMPADIKANVEKCFALLASDLSDDEVRSAIDKIISSDIADDAARSQSVAMMTAPWYRAFVKLDPSVYLPQVKCPVLALGGSWDVQVDASENLAAWKAGVPGAKIIEYPGLNHVFQAAPSKESSFNYGGIATTIEQHVLDDIADFLVGVSREN